MRSSIALRVRLLGRFEVELEPGGPVTRWERPSARRLIALLVLSGGRVRRETAAEELFPGLEPQRAANGVAKALSMARSALGPDGAEVLAADRDWLWLGEDVQLTSDLAAHMQALEDALGQPPGRQRAGALAAALANEEELLPEDLYADWTLTARRDLDDLREQARIAHAHDLDAAGEPVEARRAAWRRVLATDPESAEAAAALVSLQLGASRDTAAPAQDGHGVGRELELARLRRALTRTEQNDGSNLLVTGPAGIGKTHLLDRLVTGLRTDGWVVLRGTAVEGDRSVPYAALRAALRPVADAAPPGSHLHTVLSTGEGRDFRAPDEDGGAAREQLAAEIEGLLDAASAHAPALLVIDDVQWADDDLQRLLARVAARRTRRWALLAAARSDESTSPPLVETAERLELRPLARQLTEQLVRALAPEDTTPAMVTALARRSGGNPFFAVELALSRGESAATPRGDQSLPVSIVDLLRHRLEACTPGAQRLCRLVALIGDTGYDLLLAVAPDGDSLPSEAAVTLAAEELLRRQLLTERPGGLTVVHPLVRDAILATTSALTQSALHTAVADACADLGLDTSITAQHRLAAFESVRRRSLAPGAASAGFAAGLEARALYADATAVRLLERALDAFADAPDPDRADLRAAALDATIALGGLLTGRNRLEAAAERFEAAVALAEDDEERSRAWQSVALVAYRRGDLAAAAATYEQGLDALSGDPGLPRARLLSDLAWVQYRREGPAEALEMLREAAEQLDAAGDLREAAASWDALAIALNDVGRTDEALAASDTAFELCARVDDDRGLRTMLHLHRAPILGKAGRVYEGLAELDRVRRSPGAAAYSRSLTYWIETELHQRRGDLPSALTANDRELELLAQIDNTRHTAQALARRSVLLAGLRRPGEAREAARGARATALQAEDPLVAERVESILGGNESGISRA